MAVILREFNKKIEKSARNSEKRVLHFPNSWCIVATVVTLIALKREVAALVAGYSVERMSSYETGDKSLYQGSASGR